MVVLVAARQADAVRAGRVFPARSAGQDPAVLLPASVDRPERRCRQGDEDAGVVGDAGGDVLAAGEPGVDELVGVGAVDLGAGRAAGGAAGLAGDRQDAVGFVDGGVAVDQFADAAVDVVGAASAELSRAGQNPSRPSVNAGQPDPFSCLVNVHAKTALTEPALESWTSQLSGAGT